MIVGAGEPGTLVEIGIRVLAGAFGALLLVQGWRLRWLLGGVASFLLTLLVISLVNEGLLGRSALSGHLSWIDLVAVLAAVLGAAAALKRSVLAYGVIGLTAGGALCVWGAQVVGNESQLGTFWIIVVCIAAMALGALFTIRYEDVALILLAAVSGVVIIAAALGLSGRSQWEAALALGLALVGVAVQFHDFQQDEGTVVGPRQSESP
jgi:hypothetical protein